MYGGRQYLYEFDTRDRINARNKYQNIYQNKIQTESKGLLNVNQTFKTKDQSANYLIEYFEGMILNYISLCKSQDESINELKNLILNHDKNINFKGGNGDNEYIKNHDIYKYYHKDIGEKITVFDDKYWKTIKILVTVDYQKEYNIHITHDNNGINKIDLIIDLQHNAIIDNNKRSYNDNIYDDTLNIKLIIAKLIRKLMNYNYKNEYQFTECNFYDNGNYFEGSKSKGILVFLIRSVISLLIMILTLKNDVDEVTYKMYNGTFLLSAICKYELINSKRNNRFYGPSLDIFTGNNSHSLTYDGDHNMIDFGGDCALNVLMCVNNSDLRELFVDKIEYTRDGYEYTENAANYYIRKIKKVLSKIPFMEDFEYKKLISDYVDDYQTFIKLIIGNKCEYAKFKEGIEKNNNNALDPNYMARFDNIYKHCLKYVNIVRNNLIEYNLNNDEADTMFLGLTDQLGIIEDLQDENKNIKDYVNASLELIKIIDNIIKNGKRAFNIFYINVLISLLLIQHKLDYVFNKDIMNIIRYSENKEIIIKCFRNVTNDNDLGLFFPTYQEGQDGDKYLFTVVGVVDEPHAVLAIIKITDSIINRRIYLYDIDELMMHFDNEVDLDNCKDYTTWASKYIFVGNSHSWIYNRFGTNRLDSYRYATGVVFRNLNKLSISNTYELLYANCVKKCSSLNPLNIYNESGYLDLKELLLLNYDDCTETYFKDLYYDIKHEIFSPLIEYCRKIKNEYKNNIYDSYLSAIQYLEEKTIKILNDEKHRIKVSYHKFIKYLIKTKLIKENKDINTNIYNEYNTVASYFINTYKLDTQKFITYLNFNDNKLNDIIKNIINILNFEFRKDKKIVRGGYSNIDYNNYIIKKILIVLLIIVIIIIIVLIVLYIINKYKNNISPM